MAVAIDPFGRSHDDHGRPVGTAVLRARLDVEVIPRQGICGAVQHELRVRLARPLAEERRMRTHPDWRA
jgi:hypothetical protein